MHILHRACFVNLNGDVHIYSSNLRNLQNISLTQSVINLAYYLAG